MEKLTHLDASTVHQARGCREVGGRCHLLLHIQSLLCLLRVQGLLLCMLSQLLIGGASSWDRDIRHQLQWQAKETMVMKDL